MSTKHAYLIIAHNDIDLLQVLVNMLDDERNDIYLHPDKKWTNFDASKLRTERAKLEVLSNRIKGYWGHISLVQIEYALFRKAYESGVDYAYYHLLSGADLPIKSQNYIHAFLKDKSHIPFISYWNHREDIFYKVSRYAFGMKYEKMSPKYKKICWFLGFLRRKFADMLFHVFGARTNSDTFCKGSQWLSLPQECVRFLLEDEARMIKRLTYTRCPDEIFAQTVLNNHYFEVKAIDPYQSQDMRLVNWKSSTISPDYFTMEQWDEIVASPALFARKFSTSVDTEIIERIHKTFG